MALAAASAASVSPPEILHGRCSCGRNQYIVALPAAQDKAHVYFGDSAEDRRSQAAPLAAWLRVPLDWFQSRTESFFPDETHGSIRRIFVPPAANHARRSFCGFCGTTFAYWADLPAGEGDYISIAIGSLSGPDQRRLEDLDLLPSEESEEDLETDTPLTVPVTRSSTLPTTTTWRSGSLEGIPWFEEMIDGSRLGHTVRSRRGMGGGSGPGSSTRIEWEVSEWQDDGDGQLHEIRQSTATKRKSSASGGDEML